MADTKSKVIYLEVKLLSVYGYNYVNWNFFILVYAETLKIGNYLLKFSSITIYIPRNFTEHFLVTFILIFF